MTDKDFRDLSFRYFKGQIGINDEILLYEEIKSSANRLELFRKYKEEWRVSNIPYISDYILWDNVSSSIRNLKKNRIVKRVLSVCSVAAAVVAIACLVWYNASDVHEDIPDVMIESPFRMRTRIVLPDGSVVWLNSASQLVYNSDFGRNNREVSLKGEAFFEITKNAAHPFLVNAGNGQIKVTGTKFNVSCYDCEENIFTALMEGSISFRTAKGETIEMSPGDMLYYNPATSEVHKSVSDNVLCYSRWIEGKMDFESISVEHLLDRLSVQYGVSITYHLNTIANKEFRIYLTNSETLEEVLDALSVMLPISYRIIGKNVYIEEK